MGGQVPSNYLVLANLLEQEAKHLVDSPFPVILTHRLRQLMADNQLEMSQEDLQQAIKFLHDSGIVLHYDDTYSKLSDLYFLNPEWLCQLMGRVITIQEVNPALAAHQGVSYAPQYVQRHRAASWLCTMVTACLEPTFYITSFSPLLFPHPLSCPTPLPRPLFSAPPPPLPHPLLAALPPSGPAVLRP